MDFVSKISDVKGIQDLCKFIVIPLMAAAYISTTGFQISIKGYNFAIDQATSPIELWFGFLMIFLAKVLWVTFWALLVAGVVLVTEMYYPSASKVYTIILLSFGCMGIAAPNALPISSFMNPFWYYAAIAAGFCIPKLCEETYGEKT